MKKDSVLGELIGEVKKDFKDFNSLGWRGYAFIGCLLWSFFWMMAVDSESTAAFLLSIAFVLLGIVGAGLIFLSVFWEDIKNAKK